MTREEILSKLKNGNHRYLNSPIVHKAVDALAHGADPITVIDSLLQIIESRQSYTGMTTSEPDEEFSFKSAWKTKGGWGLEPDDPMDDGTIKHFQD